IQTITSSGGVRVGSSTYQASAGAWAQLVVLDRSTLALERNESFGSGGQATLAAAQALRSAVQGLSTDQLAIISGGGRPVSVPEEENVEQKRQLVNDFFSTVEDVGASPEGISEWRLAWFELLKQGRWSVVGVPGVVGSAY